MLGTNHSLLLPHTPKPREGRSIPRWVWWAVGALMLGNAAIAAYKVWPTLFPAVAEQAVLDPQCDLRAGPCVSVLGDDRSLSLAIEPLTIPVLQPLQLTVDLKGIEASQVEVDFAGAAMNMGFNRVTLNAQGDGRFAGEGRLPVCVRGRMLWEARVLAHTDQGLLSAPYRFETRR